MDHLLLIAHGSRLEAANVEVIALAASLQARLTSRVWPAFLEIAEPSIPAAIEAAIAAGARRIRLLPYFLTQGRHVQRDIPQIIAEKALAHPEVEFELMDYLGAGERLLGILADMAKG